MPVSTESSTFEYARDWLVSSESFVRDAMLADAVDLDGARDQARARIYREEALAEPNEDEENESGADQPPAICPPPRAIIITRENRRKRVGTGTWSGAGQMLITVEVLVPAAQRVNQADDDPTTRGATFAARRAWGEQLLTTIRGELIETSGRGDADGTPYLNATDLNVYLSPADPEEGEGDEFLAFIFEVEWR